MRLAYEDCDEDRTGLKIQYETCKGEWWFLPFFEFGRE